MPNANEPEKTHQTLVDLIYNEERANYQFMVKNLRYGMGKEVGEIDLLGYNKGVYDIYEIKSNTTQKNKEHAREQLKRAMQYLGFEKARLYYATQQIRKEEIK
ncbi:MAG TPA: hypothetical protein VI894_04115 [Candidatus Nanoarchaeia archaeon]|nr:hypothetical protein [Candidatus Nanoarchaeia archaeon]